MLSRHVEDACPFCLFFIYMMDRGVFRNNAQSIFGNFIA
jgi:hypothetical protein